jgi:hypothetical protein
VGGDPVTRAPGGDHLAAVAAFESRALTPWTSTFLERRGGRGDLVPCPAFGQRGDRRIIGPHLRTLAPASAITMACGQDRSRSGGKDKGA